MLESAPSWGMIGLLGATAVAAVTDARTGLIPNWLTLPSLLGALLIHGLIGGPGALGWATLSGFSCGLVPLVLFRAGAIGGGDVKLFAVLGALVGVHSGLEVQMTSYGIAIASVLDSLVNLELGQSLVIAGLTARSESESHDGLPGLSQIPIIGGLFGTHSDRSTRSENLIFIVPTVVDAVSLHAREQVGEALALFDEYDGDLDDTQLRTIDPAMADAPAMVTP